MRDERLSQTSTLNQLVRDRSSKEYAYASLPAPELSTHHISGCLESRYSFIAVPARGARAHISVHSCIRLELGEVRVKGWVKCSCDSTSNSFRYLTECAVSHILGQQLLCKIWEEQLWHSQLLRLSVQLLLIFRPMSTLIQWMSLTLSQAQESVWWTRVQAMN